MGQDLGAKTFNNVSIVKELFDDTEADKSH